MDKNQLLENVKKNLQSVYSSRYRAAAVLFLIAALGTVLIGTFPPPPHVVYRVPLALIAAWGLWNRSRWAFPVALIAAIVWLGLFFMILPFAFMASLRVY